MTQIDESTFLRSNSTILAPFCDANRRASILFSGPSKRKKINSRLKADKPVKDFQNKTANIPRQAALWATSQSEKN